MHPVNTNRGGLHPFSAFFVVFSILRAPPATCVWRPGAPPWRPFAAGPPPFSLPGCLVAASVIMPGLPLVFTRLSRGVDHRSAARQKLHAAAPCDALSENFRPCVRALRARPFAVGGRRCGVRPFFHMRPFARARLGKGNGKGERKRGSIPACSFLLCCKERDGGACVCAHRGRGAGARPPAVN